MQPVHHVYNHGVGFLMEWQNAHRKNMQQVPPLALVQVQRRSLMRSDTLALLMLVLLIMLVVWTIVQSFRIMQVLSLKHGV